MFSNQQELTYRSAMDGLTEIVDGMKNAENVDVDDLVQQVTRAKELIDFCDQRIRKADTEINSVIMTLQATKPVDQAPFAMKAPGGQSKPVVPRAASDNRSTDEIPF